jgi:mannose-6-phosphate isomerase-like protein (cupin superfamily)
MDEIQVISRNAIPPIQSVETGGALHELGELRDFRWNDKLRDFMPSAARFSVSWVRLGPGEVLEPHVHPIQSLMVFYAGSGEMLGDAQRSLAKDDVVVVPAGCAHGFVGGPQGLFALSIQFGEGLYTALEKPRVVFTEEQQGLPALLAYNKKRLAEFEKRPLFDLLADGTLDDPKRRKIYLDALQTWVDGNQALLFARQANCIDPKFSSVFLTHMQEEMGHDALHKDRADGILPSESQSRDALMEAITNFFTYQMYVLDNAEKAAVIHLVIENASIAYHTRATPALAKYVNDEYFDVHLENDADHAAMGEELVRDMAPRDYARLHEVVGEAWDMIGAMTDRLVELTRAG